MRANLFVDARKLGRLVDRTHRELTTDEVVRIARTYNAWHGEPDAGEYHDLPGFCKSARSPPTARSSPRPLRRRRGRRRRR